MFNIAIKFADNNGSYLLERDFANRNNTLILPNGQKITNKSEINQMIADKMGLPSEASYLSTACITQDEITIVKDEKGELRKCIENRLIGGDDINLEKILKSLTDRTTELQKGGANPGFLRVSEARATELRDSVRQIENEIDQFKKNKHEFVEKAKKLDENFVGLNIKNEQINKAHNYLKINEKYEIAKKKHAEVVSNIEKRNKHTATVKQLRTGIPNLQKRLDGLSKSEKDIREAKEVKKTCEKIEKTISELDEQIRNLKAMLQKHTDIEKDLKRIVVIKEDEVRNAKEIPREIERLRAGKEIIALVKPKASLSLSSESDTEKESDINLSAGESWSLTGMVTMRLDIKRVATIDVVNKTGAVDKEITRKKSELEKLLKKYAVEKPEELDSKFKEYRDLEKKKKDLENEINIELRASRVKNVNELQQQRKEMADKLEAEKEHLLNLKAANLSSEEEQAIIRNIKELSEKLDKEKNACSKLEGILEEMPSDDHLKEEKRKLGNECLLLETQLEELKIFALSQEEYLKLESQKRKLEEEKEKLTNELYHLQKITESETYSDEQLAKTQTNLFLEEQRVEHYRNIIKRNSILRDALNEARDKTIASVAEVLATQVAEHINIITDGKYKNVKVDEELKFMLWSDEKSDWIVPSPDLPEASSGLVDQLYFSARFALIDLICSGKKPPILMDDPFIHFDTTRAGKAMEIVEKLAEQYQIIIFTCHDTYSSQRANLVEL